MGHNAIDKTEFEDCARCMASREGLSDNCPDCQGSGVVPPHHEYEPREDDNRRVNED